MAKDKYLALIRSTADKRWYLHPKELLSEKTLANVDEVGIEVISSRRVQDESFKAGFSDRQSAEKWAADHGLKTVTAQKLARQARAIGRKANGDE